MLNVHLRLRLLAIGCSLAAIWLAWQLSQGNYLLPAGVATVAVCAVLARSLRIRVPTIALGVVLFGYIVGNRGFAQLMPVPYVPLLPAEIVLLIAGGWIVIQTAFSHKLPMSKDWMNWIVLAWFTVGTARVAFDVRAFGTMAIRDYAMNYYALFFFIGQYHAREIRARQFLIATLVAASLLLPFAVILSENFPAFFQSTLAVNGVPLVHFKGDLAFTFLALSAVILAAVVRGPHMGLIWTFATVETVYVISGENRASMLGSLVALGWLAISRLRRFALVQVVALAMAVLVVAGLALLTDNTWAKEKIDGAVERVVSLGDMVGSGTYESEVSAIKGGNNRFRSMWWRNVAAETMATNPVFGLGFGYDLAEEFLREYNPEIGEDFSARSPHSIIVSAFGRLGFVGLLVFAGFCSILAVRTWHVMRDFSSQPSTVGLWAGAWVILVSACFGVVLEGPMGAVLFWTILGIANREPVAINTGAAGQSNAEALPSRAASA